MAHIHRIIDADNKFNINPITRAIANESGKVKLVQYDHNSERFTFTVPRLVDGHDMSLCSKIEIHYINVSGNSQDKSADVYLVDDMQIDEYSSDIVTFSWLISANATKYAGTLNFLIRFVCLDGETIEYAWNTEIFEGINISSGMDNGEGAVASVHTDVLEAWKNEVLTDAENAAKRAEAAAERVEELLTEYIDDVDALVGGDT